MAENSFRFDDDLDSPVIIAGPCTAESLEILDEVASAMVPLAKELGFRYLFKASFDKANRTSIESYRGPGLRTAQKWFADIHTKHGVAILTDVHERDQLNGAAEVCQALQIPAFLCRQTDLIIDAVKTSRAINVKKGQWLAPEHGAHIANKVSAACNKFNLPVNLALTERGTSFGYENLVVDMRSLAIMAKSAPVIFDITHSSQSPGGGETTGGLRAYAPLLARAAAATGYTRGFFLEVHPDPKNAKSDAATQLSIEQATTLLKQVIPVWKAARDQIETDKGFI